MKVFCCNIFPLLHLTSQRVKSSATGRGSAKVSLSMISKAWFFQLKLFSLALTVLDVDLVFWL